MKKLTVILAAVSLLAFAGLAYGARGGHGKGEGPKCECNMDGKMMEADHHMSKFLAGLNLDDQQKAFMGEIKSRMKKESIRRTADMRIVQVEIKELLSQDTVDMKAVEAKVKQLEMIKTEMHLSHIRAMEECKTKLTPEQLKKLREMLAAGPMMEETGMKHSKEQAMKGKKDDSKHNHKKEKAN